MSRLPAASKTSFWGVHMDNTTSIASNIPDDADDAMRAGDAKQGAENCRKRRGNAGKQESLEVTELHEDEEGTGEKPNQHAGKCKGRK